MPHLPKQDVKQDEEFEGEYEIYTWLCCQCKIKTLYSGVWDKGFPMLHCDNLILKEPSANKPVTSSQTIPRKESQLLAKFKGLLKKETQLEPLQTYKMCGHLISDCPKCEVDHNFQHRLIELGYRNIWGSRDPE